MRTLIAITLALLPLLAAGASAQEPPAGAPAAAGAPALYGASGAASAGAGPIIVPPADERTMSFYRSNNLVYISNYIAVALVSILVLFTGLSARMRTFALKIGRYWVLAIPIYLIMFALIDFLVTLPVPYYELLRDHRFGQSDETVGAWFKGELLSLPSGVAFVSILMLLFYAVIRWSPRRWWLYIAIPLFLVQAGSELVAYWTTPMTRELVEMEDKQLEAEIRGLAERAGVQRAKIVQVSNGPELENGPTVSGWMNDSRIVVARQSETGLSREDQLFLAGRQLGAHRMKQQLKLDVLSCLLAILSFYLIYRSSGWLIARFKNRWGFDNVSDFASWPLFPVLFNVFFLIVQPIDAGFTRHLRHKADQFALELTQDNRACAEAYADMASDKLINPRPGAVFRLWRAFDPPLAERVEFCNTYRPWERGEPIEYGDLITEPPPHVEPARQVGSR